MNTRNKAVFWILIVFVTGVLFGGSMMFILLRQPPVYQAGPEVFPGRSLNRPSGEPSWNPDQFFMKMAEALQLDAEQRPQLRSILEHSRDRYKEVSERMKKEFGSARSQTRSEIRRILRPEQERLMDDFLARSHEERERRRQKEKESTGEATQ